MKFTCTAALLLAFTGLAAPAAASGEWSEALKIDEIAGNSTELNTDVQDGCPILSPDGRSLYLASNRKGGHGGLDIWVAHRDSTREPFGAPVNLPEPVNSAADDFCPTPLRGGRLLFVSRRTIDGVTCGMGDIYATRLHPVSGWRAPRHLDCAPNGPNTALDEQGPSLVEDLGQLYFSTSAPGVPGDLYVSTSRCGWHFGAGRPLTELNTPGNDIQPNVRKDGRELVFSTDYALPGAQGSQDIYAATRGSAKDPWSPPVNLGPGVNKPTSETRPSLSWDARTLLFGRTPGPEGSGDIFVSTR
jgi:hypothetical protein